MECHKSERLANIQYNAHRNGDIDAFNALTYMTLIKPKFAEDAIKYDKEEFEKVIPGASLFINA